MIQGTIYGHVPSKSNCYKVITLHGHGSICKTKALKQYEEQFRLQCAHRDLNSKDRFKLSVDVFFPSDRQDLDNSLKCILDCMQSCGVFVNDRQCEEINARKFVDKVNPRIVYKIEFVEQ